MASSDSTGLEPIALSAKKQQLKLASLMQNGGLMVIGETVVTLHEEVSDKNNWVAIGFGIPCLAAGEDTLKVSIASMDDGETLHEFHLSSRNKYNQLEEHFHVFRAVVPGGTEKAYGMTFAHELVADRFFAAVQQLAPEVATKTPTSSVGQRQLTEEATDFPPLSILQKRNQLQNEEEAGALTASGNMSRELELSGTVDPQTVRLQQFSVARTPDEPIEEVDAGSHYCETASFKKLESSFSERDAKVDISKPMQCKHVAHVGQDTSVQTLAHVIKTGEDPGCRSLMQEKLAANKMSRSYFPTPPPSSAINQIVQDLASCGHHLQKQHSAPSISSPCEDDHGKKETDAVSQWSELSCGENFQTAVAQLIRRKLDDEALYSKLVSFTASGREDQAEKPTTRSASVIIHDHGVVSL